jgi:hypothetical protein
MARPTVDDEVIKKAEEIVDEAVMVPLDSDELSTNKILKIIIDATYEDLENEGVINVVDDVYGEKEKEKMG